MLKAAIVSIVNYCTRHPWQILVLGALLTLAGGAYTVKHFAITTDISKLISSDLPWRQKELEFDKAFPHRFESILAVVDAPTPELATQASAALVERLQQQPQLFRSVVDLAGSEFFAKSGLLFLPTAEVEQTTKQLDEAEPLIQVLATDPTLRGLSQALSLALAGVQRDVLPLDRLAPTFTKFSTTLENVAAGKDAVFSWRELVNGRPSSPSELRHFIEIWPVLDFSALQPGQAATTAIRQAAADLKLDTAYHARVRLTGPVPIADEEFATVQEDALLVHSATVAVVLLILWLALRSARIILAVFLTLVAGLAITAAFGLMMVGALNLISIAFAVLFVGIGVDFGIQFSVRYRAERYEHPDLHAALLKAAEHAGAPLTLAAAATAAGFLSFLPTDYKGVSELGLIAGVGMIIAFVTCITMLPALLTLLNPPGEPEPLGFTALAPVDRFMDRYRIPILVGTAIVVVGGLPLLYYLEFDFNPMNLRSPKVESMATYLELRRDPETGFSSIDVLKPSLAEANQVAERLAKLPEVSRTMTLESFVPQDQEQKLKLIAEARKALEPSLQEALQPPPTDAENVVALNDAVDDLTKIASGRSGPGADASKRLAAVIGQLARSSEALRAKAEAVLVEPLKVGLDGLRSALQAEPVTVDALPADLKRSWIAQDGRTRVQVNPKGDPNDNETLRQFARAVQAVEPAATGGPISILESGRTIVRAFLEAGFWALLSISILLWITLRRVTDVLLTLIPLLVAGVVTLEICVVVGMKLNFANIIALPLLLGVGVAFKIYYIMAWRGGQTNLLQSTLTRAVFFSALTTATAFGSLWLSSHPGTSSMGKLLALSLATTLAAAVLFQPILMGPPREVDDRH